MKKMLFGIQIAFVFIFLATFVVSFTHIDKIANDSKELVVQKVVVGVNSKVDVAEEVLRTKAAESVLKMYQIETALEEIELYRANPQLYVESVVNESREVLSSQSSNISNPLKRALLDKVFSWKSSLKNHFQSTLTQLIIDIRMFLISNVIGLIVASLVVFRSKNTKSKEFAVGAIITLAIATSSVTYLDRNWLYAILLKDYAGYSYPLTIVISSIWLCYEYFNEKSKNA